MLDKIVDGSEKLNGKLDVDNSQKLNARLDS
jgi:hypothetical protein